MEVDFLIWEIIIEYYFDESFCDILVVKFEVDVWVFDIEIVFYVSDGGFLCIVVYYIGLSVIGIEGCGYVFLNECNFVKFELFDVKM